MHVCMQAPVKELEPQLLKRSVHVDLEGDPHRRYFFFDAKNRSKDDGEHVRHTPSSSGGTRSRGGTNNVSPTRFPPTPLSPVLQRVQVCQVKTYHHYNCAQSMCAFVTCHDMPDNLAYTHLSALLSARTHLSSFSFIQHFPQTSSCKYAEKGIAHADMCKRIRKI
jgi:hypothetical protein